MTTGSPPDCSPQSTTTLTIPGAEYVTSRLMSSNPTTTTTTKKKYCARCFSSSETLMRCSRCKVVQYCSRDCQRSHYKTIHRGGCQSLSDIRTTKKQKKQEQMGSGESSNSNSNSSDSNADNNESITTTIVDLTRQEANLIFQMAYRYSDNIEHGRYMYGEACFVYSEALELEARHSNNNNNNDDDDDGSSSSTTTTMWLDHLRLLWVSLGYFDAFLGSLFPTFLNKRTDGSDEFSSSTIYNNAAVVVAQLCEQNLWNKVKESEEDAVDRNDAEDQRPKTKLTRAVQLGILLLKLQYIASLNDSDCDGDSDNNRILRPKKNHTKVEIIQKYNEQLEMVKTYLKESGIEMIEHLLDGGEDFGIDSDQQIKNNGDVVLWMSFFNRSNAMGGARFGPEALGWQSSTSSPSSSSSLSSDAVTLPPFPDFYIFLQDMCFWDAKINAVIGQILDGGDGDDDDDDGNYIDDDGGFDQTGQNSQGHYSLGGHLK